MENYILEESLGALSPYPFIANTQQKSGVGMTAYPHIHDDVELIYVLRGEYEVFLNGNKHYFKTGDLLVINCREIHMIFSIAQGDNEYAVIRTSLEALRLLGSEVDSSKFILPFRINSPSQKKIFTEEELRGSGVHEAVTEALCEVEEKKFGFELAATNAINRILLTVLRLRNADYNSKSVFNEKSGDINKAFEYIEKNYASDITMDKLASICSMSYSYFSRTFKAVTAQSFSEYLLGVRLREAESLLAATDTPVTDIAYKTGFSTLSYFIAKFREKMGITPKQYRKRILDTIKRNKLSEDM